MLKKKIIIIIIKGRRNTLQHKSNEKWHKASSTYMDDPQTRGQLMGNQKVFTVHVSHLQEEGSSKIMVWKEEGKMLTPRRKII